MSGENGGNNDVNIGHLDPQCGCSAAEHLKYAAYGVRSNFLVWFGAHCILTCECHNLLCFPWLYVVRVVL